MYETNGSSVSTTLPRQQSPETIDLLLTRRSVVAAKQCEPGPTAAELNTILRCATRVPDHKKLAPWRIQVLQGDARQAHGNTVAEIYATNHPDAAEEVIAFERARFLRAPLVLVVSTKIVDEKRAPRWEQILSGGAVCQNILIAATALGYASQWLSEWYSYDEQVKASLRIAPADEILGYMYIGSAMEKPDERERPTLESVVEFL